MENASLPAHFLCPTTTTAHGTSDRHLPNTCRLRPLLSLLSMKKATQHKLVFCNKRRKLTLKKALKNSIPLLRTQYNCSSDVIGVFYYHAVENAHGDAGDAVTVLTSSAWVQRNHSFSKFSANLLSFFPGSLF